MKVKRSGVGVKVVSPRLIGEPEDEDEELSDEEDTYDIDDSSFEADSATIPDSPTGDELGREKISSRRHVMSSKRKSRSRSRSRPHPFALTVDSPGRFASVFAHTPTIAPHSVESSILSSPSPDSSPPQSSQSGEAQCGTRDDIRPPEPQSRIPRAYELALEPAKTPIRGSEHHEHRAFAVWGQDESDSNASDSET